MAVYPCHKCIFVHIPKTGGSSVTTILKRDSLLSSKHEIISPKEQGATLKELIGLAGKDVDEYFSFCFVRNPWDRFVSAYHYVIQRRPELTAVSAHDNFTDFTRSIGEDPAKYLSIRYFRPQWSFLEAGDTGRQIDFVGRFENFSVDLKYALNKIGRPHLQIRHRKKSQRSDYRHYFNNETRKIVANVYARDIENFGYSFNDGTRRTSSFLKGWSWR